MATTQKGQADDRSSARQTSKDDSAKGSSSKADQKQQGNNQGKAGQETDRKTSGNQSK